jgi:hypothetical protein
MYDPTNYFATHFQTTTILDNTKPTTVELLSPANSSSVG